MKSSSIKIPLLAVFLAVCTLSCSNNGSDNPSTPEETPVFAKGADLGWITEMEDKGYKFYTSNGAQMECTALFKSLGFNAVRQRVWVNPTEKYCGREDLVEKCLRAQNLGMKIMIDFHLSDWWADPGKQNKPEAWKNYDVAALATAVASHVEETLNALKVKGIDVTWVQVGNEVTNGMLWETCRVSGTDAANFARCFKAGASSVKTVYPNAQVILHIDNAWNWNILKWFYDLMKTSKVDYDIIGLSLYPSYWDDAKGAYPDWTEKTYKAVANFKGLHDGFSKPVMLVEFGMPASLPQESKECLQYLLDNTKSYNWFKGIFLWEPESEKSRNGYEYGAFSDGKPTVALDPFKN